MKVGDCYLMVKDSFVSVFCITRTSTYDSCCSATSICFEKNIYPGVSYTRYEEDYSNELMESRIPVPSSLYDQLKAMTDDLVNSIQTLLNKGIINGVYEAKVNNSFYDGHAIYTLLEQVSQDIWKVRYFHCDDDNICPKEWEDNIDISDLVAKGKLVSNETMEKTSAMYYEWYDKAFALVEPYIK